MMIDDKPTAFQCCNGGIQQSDVKHMLDSFGDDELAGHGPPVDPNMFSLT